MLRNLFASLQDLPWLQATHFTNTTLYLLGFSLLLMLWGLQRILRRRKSAVKGIRAFTYGLVISLITLAHLIITTQIAAYPLLIPEREIAELEFRKGPGEDGDFIVHLVGIDTDKGKTKLLASTQKEWRVTGHEWRLTARALLANRSRVRFHRLVTRSVNEVETGRARRAYLLMEKPNPDLWKLLNRKLDWFPGLQAKLIVSDFIPIAPGAKYRIALHAEGITARRVEPTSQLRPD